VFEYLLAHLKVDRLGGGRARTRPDRVRGDKAYSSRAIRNRLRRSRIGAVIPEPSDQIAHRKRRGARGGRPPAFDAADYKGRNVVERNFNDVKQWRGLATRYDKLAIVYRAAAVLAPSPSGYPIYQTRPSRIKLGHAVTPANRASPKANSRSRGHSARMVSVLNSGAKPRAIRCSAARIIFPAGGRS